jgi:hypothetical protein
MTTAIALCGQVSSRPFKGMKGATPRTADPQRMREKY